MAWENDLDAKYFQALLNGLVKMHFDGDKAITHEFLREQIFGGSQMSAESIAAFIAACEGVFVQGGAEDWGVPKLEKYLTGVGMKEDHIAAFLIVWKASYEKVHKAVVDKSVWNCVLNSMSWRIDVVSTSKQGPLVQEPVAIIQMEIGSSGETNNTTETLQFECSPDRIRNIVAQIATIEKCIAAST